MIERIDREDIIIRLVALIILWFLIFYNFLETKIQFLEHQEKIWSMQHVIEGNKRIIERYKKIIELQKEKINILIKMHRVIECESRYNHNIYGDGGRAYGIAQFHKSTFQWLSKKSNMRLKYKSRKHQILLLRWAIENDYGYLWTCYRRCCQGSKY